MTQNSEHYHAWADISTGLESATQSLATAIKAASQDFKK
jgi:hypothetical protein